MALILTASTSTFAAYDVRFLDAVGGQSSGAFDINDSGQIVGWSQTANGWQHATLWSGSTVTDLASALPFHSYARAINSSGLAVGIGYPSGPGLRTPILWKDGVQTVLPNAPNQYNEGSSVYGINDAGIVAGTATIYPTGETAAIWNGHQVSLLSNFSGINRYSDAYGINNAGLVVGSATIAEDHNNHATVWRDGMPTDLGTIGGLRSLASAINDAGIIVGSGTLKDKEIGAVEAVMWIPGQDPMQLTSLGGPISFASDLNELGQIVGVSSRAGESIFRATLWDNGSLFDLNTYLSAADIAAGWILNEATGINESGWIVGLAHNTFSGLDKGFLLSTPVVSAVPEPETYLMMLLGLMFIGYMAKRKRSWDAGFQSKNFRSCLQ